MHESADLFGQRTEKLMKALVDGGPSPWGDNDVRVSIDHINEMLGQACRHLHTNLGMISVGIRSMAEWAHTTEQVNTDAVHAAGQSVVPPTGVASSEKGRAGWQ